MLQIDFAAAGEAPHTLPAHSGYAGKVAGRDDEWSASEGEEVWAERLLTFRTIMLMKMVANRARARVAAKKGRKPKRDLAPKQLRCSITGRKFCRLAEIPATVWQCVRPLYGMGQPHLLWANTVMKHSSKGKLKERVLVLTPTALYSGAGKLLLRSLALEKISELLLSGPPGKTQAEAWTLVDRFALRVPEEHDYLFSMTGADKEKHADEFVEIMGQLCKHHRKGKPFSVERMRQIDPKTLTLRPPKGWKEPPMAQMQIS